MKFIGIALSFMMSVFTEVWTGEIEKRFREEHLDSHLMGVTDYSSLVASVGKAKAIHLVEAGIDPQVFIDGNSPYATFNSTDGDIVLTLRRLDTENSRITDEELHGISYDKIGLTVETHGDVLIETCHALFNYQFAPQDESNNDTPLLRSSGDERIEGGVATGKKKVTHQDFALMKKKFDNLKIPKKDRRAVLCSEHILDLITLSEQFERQWNDKREGKVLRLYGFDIYEEIEMPKYSASTNGYVKIPFGGTPIGLEYECSFFYHPKFAWVAHTNPEMYHSKAKEDATNRENQIGFRKYFSGGPKTQRAYGAIVSSRV